MTTPITPRLGMVLRNSKGERLLITKIYYPWTNLYGGLIVGFAAGFIAAILLAWMVW